MNFNVIQHTHPLRYFQYRKYLESNHKENMVEFELSPKRGVLFKFSLVDYIHVITIIKKSLEM